MCIRSKRTHPSWRASPPASSAPPLRPRPPPLFILGDTHQCHQEQEEEGTTERGKAMPSVKGAKTARESETILTSSRRRRPVVPLLALPTVSALRPRRQRQRGRPRQRIEQPSGEQEGGRLVLPPLLPVPWSGVAEVGGAGGGHQGGGAEGEGVERRPGLVVGGAVRFVGEKLVKMKGEGGQRDVMQSSV